VRSKWKFAGLVQRFVVPAGMDSTPSLLNQRGSQETRLAAPQRSIGG
jgi:hypothetical protein